MSSILGFACLLTTLITPMNDSTAALQGEEKVLNETVENKKKIEVVKGEEGIELKTKKFTIKPYGFIRNDFYYDSRVNFETANGLFYILPKDESLNEKGEDMNKISSANFMSMATRLGFKITGPDVLKAKTLAVVEGDFAGFGSTTYLFRLRQAHFDLQWQKLSLIMGQTWHPMFGDVVPEIQSLATGCPFQPFNRSPQVRLNWQYNERGRLFGAALWQFQYTTTGPTGTSSSYMVKGKMPEFYLGWDWKSKGFKLGLGADLMRLSMPDSMQIASLEKTVSTEDHILSCAFDVYAQYYSPSGKLKLKAKSIYGGNLSHLLMVSGMGLSTQQNGNAYEWTPLNNSTSWLDVVYGEKLKFGLFLGYMKNLGSRHALMDPSTTYVFGANNIDHVARIAPMICYDLKHWSFGVEYERTTIGYGTLNTKDGKVEDTHNVSNNRVIAVMMFYF